jgi:hypothetical protein
VAIGEQNHWNGRVNGETSLVVDRTIVKDDVHLSVNEGFGIYLRNDFMNDNRVRIAFEGGRRTVLGVGGKAGVIETGSKWIKIAGCLGIETSGEDLFYEDAAERNTPQRWKSLLQDRVFLKPETKGQSVRDFPCVIRQGRAGAGRLGEGVERLHTEKEGVRAFRFRTRTGTACVAVNFSSDPVTCRVGQQTIAIPAMDTVII